MQVALFPGDSELQQLLHIFKLLGTPSEDEWAGVTKLRDWHEFPNWAPQDLTKARSCMLVMRMHSPAGLIMLPCHKTASVAVIGVACLYGIKI